MGFYIGTGPIHGKVEHLCNTYGATKLNHSPSSLSKLEESEALICVIENPLFEAAGLAYSDAELDAFAYPDGRRKTWLTMDKKKAHELSGYR